MIAHTSNYKVVGFTESVQVKEIVKLAKKNKIPVFLDLGSGTFINYEKFGLPNEKTIQHYLKMGIDIISFSGDKLLGGIQSGFICGKIKIIKKIYQNSMYRALRCDKITISIMENILRTYIDKDKISKDNLTFKLLTRDRKKIELIGKKILKSINNSIIKKYNLELVDSFVQAGSGSLPIENIESMAIRIHTSIFKASEISLKFRQFTIPTIGYIKGKKFYIDLKAVPNNQVKDLITSIKNCLI
jgi:L-seryl-tRNA(Ser) seleniumtransferase